MVHASLFSGIGGFDLAAEWMGWENAFHCEINEWCSQVLKYHFPNSKHYADITKTEFTEWRGKVDIITGGFPCQPFSLAGQRKGAADDRYLWPEMLRVIREIRPTWVIGENVGGIVTMVQPGEEIEVECQSSLFETDNKETILAQEYVVETVCRDLESEGYSVQPILIPACAVGAPHRRDRIWFIANSDCNDARRCRHGEIGRAPGTNQAKQEEWEWLRYNIERISKERVASDSKCKGGGQILQDMQSIQSNGNRVNSTCSEWNATNSERIGFQGAVQTRGWRYGLANSHCRKDWSKFPSQPPVCSGNDGFSLRLDANALLNGRKPKGNYNPFAHWRKESVKAYGNAIVPQVAYEIFKAIEVINE